MEVCLMLDVVSPFILWPIGIALGGLLFFEIEKRSWRVIQWPAGRGWVLIAHFAGI
jgi:hypothetical protein